MHFTVDMIEVKMITLFVLCSISLLPNSFCLNGKQVVEYSVRQYKRAINGIKTGIEYPYEGRPSSDKWSTTGAVRGQWTAGFYPGILWQIFNYTKEDIWRDEAIKATDALFDDQFNTETHDVGFMIMSSYGNGYRLTSNSSYSKVIERAAHSLAKRFNRKYSIFSGHLSINQILRTSQQKSDALDPGIPTTTSFW